MTSSWARGLRPASSRPRRRAGLLLAVLAGLAATLVLAGGRGPSARAAGHLNVREVGTPLICLTATPPIPSICPSVPPSSSLAAISPAAGSLTGTGSSLVAPSSNSSPPSPTTRSGSTVARTSVTRRPAAAAPPLLGRVRLRLPTAPRLPSSAPFGPGVVVAKSKAILDLGVPPAVAPLEPLAGLNFASSPVFWPFLVVVDVLAVVGVFVLARRAWSRREPA
ncbi:MAG: hypothetical protein ABR541_03290 [Candidatus Dormibacteria bacterium]